MSLSDEAEANLCLLLFNNVGWANIGDATGLRGSTAAGVFYLTLHSADPGEAGTQSTNEISYTGYARPSVARSGAGWTCSGDTASNAAAITWGSCTAGTATATHFGIGTASSGAGHLVGSGPLVEALAIGTGINPTAAIGQLTANANVGV